MGRGKSCVALAAGARSTHYVHLRVEIAGKESNKQGSNYLRVLLRYVDTVEPVGIYQSMV